MNLIKFFNRHVFTSIILYFALMATVAWAVTEHIAARTKLAVMPADNDVIPIYDTDAGLGYGIEVSVFRGTNLNAIVNAEAGVASPGITMYDSSTEAGTAFVYGTSTGAYDVVMSLGVEDSSSASGSPYIQLNGTTETVDVQKPMSAPSIDAGTTWTTVSQVVTPYNAQTLEGDKCNHVFYLASSATDDTEIDLPSTGLCGTAQGKTLRFVNLAATADLYLDPADGTADTITALTNATCAAGARYRIDEGEWVLLHGVSATQWRVAGGTGACE